MSDLDADEQALLAAEDKPAARRRGKVTADVETPAPAAAPARGPYTPVQFDDDGWGDRPIQMRG